MVDFIFFFRYICRLAKLPIATAVKAEINPEGLSDLFFRAPQVSRDHVEMLALRGTR